MSLACGIVRGGELLLGLMPLLREVSFETPLLTAADMLVQCCQMQDRVRRRTRDS